MTQRYEYRVVPAPRRGEKARGVKTTEDRFAYALTTLMNEMAGAGWDYQRAESLPVDERAGLTGTKTTFQNLLVFRRSLTTPGLVAGEPVLRAAETAAPIAPVATAVAPTIAPVAVAASAEVDPVAEPAPEVAVKPLRLGAAISPPGSSPALGPAQSAEPTK